MLRRRQLTPVNLVSVNEDGSVVKGNGGVGTMATFSLVAKRMLIAGLILALAIGVTALVLSVVYSHGTQTNIGNMTITGNNFTCGNVTNCLESAPNVTLSGNLSVAGDVQIPGGYISTVNVISPYSANRDFTIIGGPGIAVSGGLHSLTIRNNINITLVGSIFTIRVLFGNITVTMNNQSANTFFAGPISGPPDTPTLRHIVPQDLPLLPLNASSFYGVLPVALGGTGTSVPLLPGQLFTGDGMGNLIPVYLQGGYDVYVTNFPNGTIQIDVEKAVHSVGLVVPQDIFNATVSLVEENGNLTFVVLPQTGNQVWASPANGSTGIPTFRTLTEQDLPLISLAAKVYGVLPVANGGTNSSLTLQNGRIMVSNDDAIVEGVALLDGQVFIGKTGSLPVAAVPTGSGGILVVPGPGTLHILMTSAPSFASLNVAGSTTLGNYTSCNQPLQPSCLDISMQSCPGGALASSCIPTSGLHLTDLTVDFLTIVNQTFQVTVDTINGSAFWVENLYADNVVLNNAMTCSGNASISPSCVDISAKECPLGPLGESCFPDSLVLANLQVTANVTVANVYCVGGFIDASCVPDRFKTINGLYANFTSHDFTISPLDSTIVVQADGLYGISIGTTLFTANQSAHAVLIGPVSGSTGAPTFRLMDQSDLPPLAPGYIYIGNTSEAFNVSLSLPATLFSETVQSIGNGGTLVASLANQSANLVFAGPSSGSAAAPTFRALNYSDLPPILLSVALDVPADEFVVFNSPLGGYGGTLVVNKTVQNGNTFWAGAADGTNGVQPAFRKIVYKDLANLNLTLAQLIGGGNTSDPVPTTLMAGSGIIINVTEGAITISASINASNIGTVTSVGLALPGSVFSVSNSPVVMTGTLTGSFVNQAANTVFAGPTLGSPAAPGFRGLVLADLPHLHGGQMYIGDPLTNLTSITNLTAGNAISIITAGSITTISSTVSVDLALPVSVFSVTGNPVTNSGTLTATFISQAARTFFAAPAVSAGTPSFRTMTYTDLPPLMSGQLYIGQVGTAVASSLSAGTGITISTGPGTITITNNFMGTVTSVGLALPVSLFSISGSPVTSSGTLSATLISQLANTVFAAPNGAPGTPSFRALAAADIPSLDTSKLTTGVLPIARGGTNSGTALNNNRIMISSGGAIVERAAMTNGQLLIGSTGAAPVANTISAGTAIVVTNGPGTISVGVNLTEIPMTSAMGEISGFNPTVPTTTVITAISNGFTNMVELNAVTTTLSAGAMSITMPTNGKIQYTGAYTVFCHVASTITVASAGSPNQQYVIVMAINGIARNNTRLMQRTQAASDIQSTALHGYVPMSTNDVLSLQVGNMSSGDDFNVFGLNLFAMCMRVM